ncbi:MAG TPA: hypothetical protein VHD81_05725 [Mycobacteriales bacterium]|nr:hypothetical protein [Mycobacteriales bacterium]
MSVQRLQLDESEVVAKWQELAPLIDRMMERVGTQEEFPVGDGSSLRGDDRASDPFHVSHLIRQCLNAGIDHLHAAKVLVVDARLLHVAAPSSLARGAIENFAAAFWVLGPRRRVERVERALRWYAKNYKDQHNAAHPIGRSTPGERDANLNKLYAVGAKHGIDNKVIRTGYSSTEVVKHAEANAPTTDMHVLLPWQVCSGFAHGRPWAYLGVLDREEHEAETAGVMQLSLTSNLSMALYPTLAAARLLQDLLRLYQRRAGALLPEAS